jgi:hypothetical protein
VNATHRVDVDPPLDFDTSLASCLPQSSPNDWIVL